MKNIFAIFALVAGYLLAVNTTGYKEAFFALSISVVCVIFTGISDMGKEDISYSIAYTLASSVFGMILGEILTLFIGVNIPTEKILLFFWPK